MDQSGKIEIDGIESIVEGDRVVKPVPKGFYQYEAKYHTDDGCYWVITLPTVLEAIS